MRKVIASEWVTLDGVFDGSTVPAWFEPYHSDERAAWIQEGIFAADGFLMGRTTYEMLAPYWSTLTKNEMGVADKLNAAPKYVVSTKLQTGSWNNTTIIGTPVVDAIAQLRKQEGHSLLIMGSATLVHTLITANLLDELRLLVQPIIFGKGKRLFRDDMPQLGLELKESRTLSKGVVSLTYQPARTSP